MGNKKASLEQVRAYIRNLRNPYASLSIDMPIDEETRNVSRYERKHEHLRNLQDPYATLAIFGDPERRVDSLVQGHVQPVRPTHYGNLSKKDFQSQCRRIFSQYVPPEEGRTLRAHHRDFVTRNESKSAEARYLLVAQLKKYDLSAVGNFRPRFNRERDALTKEKLQKIEREIDK